MGITKFVLRRPVTTFLVILCLIVFGISSLFGSKLELIPNMEMPMMVVTAVYPGASPKDVNDLVTKPIEDKVETLSSVKQVTSYSNENMAFVLLQYEYGTNMDKAYTDLKKSLDSVKGSLPDDVDTPNIMEFNINDAATMTIAVNNDAQENLYNYVDNNIVPEIEKLSSVASVDVSGGRENYIKVEAIPEKLAQYKLSLQSLAQAVSGADFSYPAGKTTLGSQFLSVTTGETFDTLESLKNIPITLPSGSTIYLQDVAKIYSTYADASGIGRYDGKDTIALGIHMQESSSAGEVSRQLHKVIDELTSQNSSLQMVVVNDNSEQIQSSLQSVQQTMIMAVIISMVILWLFFGDVKASLIVGTSIPLSIMTALILMRAVGYSLNMITMGSLVLGVGMMVDNSIVVLESCFRATKGKGFDEFHKAALEGSGTVLNSIIGSTLTTCVVFLPLGLLSGLSGQMFGPLGFTIVFCMTASLISAMTVVPLCYVLYRPKERTTAPLSGPVRAMQDFYRGVMRRLLRHKALVMIASAALLAVSILLATQLRVELMPDTDEGQIAVTVEMRPGIDTDHASEVLSQVEDYVKADPDVDHYLLSYGSTGLSYSTGSSATLTAYLKDKRSRTTREVANAWRPELTKLPDTNITVAMSSATAMSSTSNGDVQYILQSATYDKLKSNSDAIVKRLKQDSRLTKVHSTLENSAPVLQIEVDPTKAEAEGLTPAGIGASVNAMLSGVDKAATLDVNGSDIEVRVEYPDGQYDNIEKIRGIMLPTQKGSSVALTDVADVYFKDSPQSITRNDKQYQVTVSASYADGVTKKEKSKLKDTIFTDTVQPMLESGVTRGENMNDQMMNEEFAALGRAILIAVFLVFVVMAAQFESPKFSLMVMTTIPFSLIGVFGLLFLMDVSVSMTSILGFLMLVGTVVNNGILYVDTANQYQVHMNEDDALVEAGATRLRPILMTTLTTVVSMIPMALAFGDNGEIMQGLAVVNVGGLTASTILSLLMLPVYYKLMSNKRNPKFEDID
jgi:multidrug efflux pump subunit AcrB